ncbi:shikimate kinase [Pontibacter akesuensis]|nr:shikimate kinase [Pontibacter akesuensis]
MIGMMGSGKTTLGRQLAQEIGYAFVDLDAYIVAQQGRSIAQLFAEGGEARFRELERQALEELVENHGQAVIATGGGAPCFFDNIGFINHHGQSVFLDVPVEVLANRLITQGQEQRPLLAGKSRAELISYLAETIAHRKQFYERASYTLSASEQRVQSIKKWLNL